jgi:hypothetical protein
MKHVMFLIIKEAGFVKQALRGRLQESDA